MSREATKVQCFHKAMIENTKVCNLLIYTTYILMIFHIHMPKALDSLIFGNETHKCTVHCSFVSSAQVTKGSISRSYMTQLLCTQHAHITGLVRHQC